MLIIIVITIVDIIFTLLNSNRVSEKKGVMIFYLYFTTLLEYILLIMMYIQFILMDIHMILIKMVVQLTLALIQN
mgnify:CR=1 FL=1